MTTTSRAGVAVILPDDHLAVEWLNPNDICFGDPQPCDLGTVATYRDLMASGPDGAHLAPPMVSPDPDHPGRFRLRDGKHRYLAQLALGRGRIRCLVITSRPQEQP
jgi:hypothetical protein